jgi:hypothetical protein
VNAICAENVSGLYEQQKNISEYHLVEIVCTIKGVVSG